MRLRFLTIIASTAVVWAVVGCRSADSDRGMRGDAPSSDRQTSNDQPTSGRGEPQAAGNSVRFQKAERWARRFENPERDRWQKPEHVIKVMDFAADARIADIGSGTGYFPVRFARAAPRGFVYGVDIEPEMVSYLNDRAKQEKLSNLKSLRVAPNDPQIPEPVDVVFLCNTYHHIENRVAYFRNCKKYFRPGGRLVIVDFFKRKLPVGPQRIEHKLAKGVVMRELSEAGYKLLTDDAGLPYQYLLILAPTGD